MKAEPNKNGEKPLQDKKTGKFAEGNPGGPGRPEGAGVSITTAIKRELEKVPEGQKATYLELLVKKILKKGIVEGSDQTIKQIWNYIDGMPKQEIEQTTLNVDVEDDITKEKADEIKRSIFNSTPQPRKKK